MGPSAVLLCLLAQDAPIHTGTIELEFELSSFLIEFGQEGRLSEWHVFDLVARGRRSATWHDTWTEVDKAGRPVVIERTFELLEGSYTVGNGLLSNWSQVLPLRSPLVGHPMRAERGEEGWAFEFLEQGAPEDEWLEGLTVTPGIAGLVRASQEDGPWRLDDPGARDWMHPFGQAAFVPEPGEGSYAEFVLLAVWTVDPTRHIDPAELRMDGALTRVLDTARFEVELMESIDLRPHVLALAERMDMESLGARLESARVDVTWKGHGTLEGLSEPGAPLAASLEVDVGAVLEVELWNGWLLRVHYDGSMEQTQTWR